MKNLFKSATLVKLSLLLLLTGFSQMFLSSCSDDDTKAEDLKSNEITSYKTPKYIFFFIGDGMATPQVNLTEAALNDPEFKKLKSASIGVGEMAITKFPVAGFASTYAEDRYITGSAAAATALATGYKTTINTISKNGDRTEDLKTMAEMAKEKGMRVGIVSSVSIDHATPACFYAHEDTRKNYSNIAAQMATSDFDYFGGGYTLGKSQEGGAIINDVMETAGYSIVTTRSAFNAVEAGTKCWAYNHTLDASAALYYELDRPEDHISLAEFTQRGIELLDNEKGFFMMVEAGKVDWACHANDAVAAAYDMVVFDEAIAKAVDFYNEHKDETLIVITGDHECGGLSLGFASTGYESAFELLKYQTISYDLFTAKVRSWKGAVSFDMALDSIETYFGLGNASLNAQLALSDYELGCLETAYQLSLTDDQPEISNEEKVLLYGGYDPLTVTVTHLLNNKAGLDWTSYTHTGVPVPVFAMGQGQYEFNGYYDNTDVAKKIITIGELE